MSPYRSVNMYPEAIQIMKPHDFVQKVKVAVRDAAVADVISQLEKPSGRRPAEKLKLLSSWYNNLPVSDRQAVAEVARMAAHNSVFGFLCVLDGVRAVNDPSEKGEVRLTYVEGDESDLLAPSPADLLHDILNQQ